MSETVFDVEGFLFDMDGTLVDSHAIVERVWAGFCARHGLSLEELLAFSHGRQTWATVDRFLPEAPQELRDAEILLLNTTEHDEVDGVVAVPGAAALLARLRALGAPVALVTSADLKLATTRMAAAGLEMPDVVVTAEDTVESKPHPAPYLRGAELLSVDIFTCVAFEDAPAGISSVRAAGAGLVVVGDEDATGGVGVADLRAVSVERHGMAFRVTISS